MKNLCLKCGTRVACSPATKERQSQVLSKVRHLRRPASLRAKQPQNRWKTPQFLSFPSHQNLCEKKETGLNCEKRIHRKDRGLRLGHHDLRVRPHFEGDAFLRHGRSSWQSWQNSLRCKSHTKKNNLVTKVRVLYFCVWLA